MDENFENTKALTSIKTNPVGEITETINLLASNTNYCIITFNGEQICKGLIYTGNSIQEQVAISSRLHRKLGIGYKTYSNQKVGIANREPK